MQVWLGSSQLLQRMLESDISLQRGENHVARSEFLCNRISLNCFLFRMVTAKAGEPRLGCAHTGHRKSGVRLNRNLYPVIRAGFTKFYLSMCASTREHRGCRTCGRVGDGQVLMTSGCSKEPNRTLAATSRCPGPKGQQSRPKGLGVSLEARG